MTRFTPPLRLSGARPKKSVGRTGKPPSERQEDLLAKAAVLIAEAGYHATSMRDVARATGCSLAGLYHYFASKEDLLFSVQHRVFASLLGEQERGRDTTAPLDVQLATLVENHLAFFTRHAAELKVCTYELESLSGARYRQVEELRRRYYRLLADIVTGLLTAAGRPAGEAEVRHLTLYIFGMLNWIFMWFDSKRDKPVERLGSEIVELVLHGLCGRTRADTGAGTSTHARANGTSKGRASARTTHKRARSREAS